MTFEERQLILFNKILMFLFIIQLPAQAIKFYFYGFGEDTIGTYATHGGGLTTVIPLVALGYFIAYYCLYRKNVIFLILCLGFIAYGIIGLKLALLFLYPVSFMLLYYLNVIKIKGIRIPGDIYKILFISLLTIVVGSTIIKYQVRTNVERKLGGSIDLSYALKSSLKYTTGMRGGEPELAKGRAATTKMAFKYIFDEGIIRICFGYGPGVLTKLKYGIVEKANKTTIEKIAGSYGHTGAVFMATEYGIIGLVIITTVYLIFIKNSWYLYKREKDQYWKAFASGSLFFSCVTLFIFLFYNKTTIIGGTIQPVFYYCMALVYKRKKELVEVSK
jgi:hypothetical protein